MEGGHPPSLAERYERDEKDVLKSRAGLASLPGCECFLETNPVVVCPAAPDRPPATVWQPFGLSKERSVIQPWPICWNDFGPGRTRQALPPTRCRSGSK